MIEIIALTPLAAMWAVTPVALLASFIND